MLELCMTLYVCVCVDYICILLCVVIYVIISVYMYVCIYDDTCSLWQT